jgi:guanylate kinase
MSGNERGILVIISSPSGAGKTTLARKLLAEFPNMQFSVSYTTRPKRNNEEEGRDYHFVDDATFDAMVEGDEFAEWAEVHGNRYGTSRAAVEKALGEGIDFVFDVDWQGGRALSKTWPDDCLMIFILPPDLQTLARRLRSRATDEESVIQRRLRTAIHELEHHTAYDYLIVNNELERAYATLRAVYLYRRYGGEDRADVAHSLADAARLVQENRDANVRAHAERMLTDATPEAFVPEKDN